MKTTTTTYQIDNLPDSENCALLIRFRRGAWQVQFHGLKTERQSEDFKTEREARRWMRETLAAAGYKKCKKVD